MEMSLMGGSRSGEGEYMSFADLVHTQMKNEYERKLYAKQTEDSEDVLLRVVGLALACIATLGICLLCAILLIDWDGKDHHPVQTVTGTFLKVVNFGVTVVLIVVLLNFYSIQASRKRRQWAFRSAFVSLRYSSLKWKLLGEVVVCIIQPIPFADHIWGLGDKIGLFMFCRIYMWVRVVRDFSDIYRWRKHIIRSNPIYRKVSPQFGWNLVIRALFFRHTASVIIVISFVSTMIASFAILVAEREHNKELRNFGSAVYFTTVSMTSIGYGDICPMTFWGRMVSMAQGLLGIIIIAIMSGVLTNKLTPGAEQKFAVNWVQWRNFRRQEGYYACVLIQSQWRWHRKRIDVDRYRANYKRCVKNLRKMRVSKVLSTNEQSEMDKKMDEIKADNKFLRDELLSIKNMLNN